MNATTLGGPEWLDVPLQHRVENGEEPGVKYYRDLGLMNARPEHFVNTFVLESVHRLGYRNVRMGTSVSDARFDLSWDGWNVRQLLEAIAERTFTTPTIEQEAEDYVIHFRERPHANHGTELWVRANAVLEDRHA